MLSRARSALPGMAVAVLLAGPAFAPGALAADTTVRAPAAAAATRAPAKRIAKPAPAITQAAAPQASAPQSSTSQSPVISDSNLETVWRQSGVASWYGGKKWQGRRTASGARYDERQLTAAHATLPIGTKVRVTLEGSDRSVIVVINDRPGTRTRIIDLSRQAAADLGILSQGIGVVTLMTLHGG